MGIFQQVLDHPAQQIGIGVDGDGRRLLSGIQAQIQLERSPRMGGRKARRRLRGQSAAVERLGAQSWDAVRSCGLGIEARHGQHVVDQLFQLGQIFGDVAQGFPRCFGVTLVRQVQRHADARQGRAQLVRDAGQQLALRAQKVGQAIRHLVEGVRQLTEFILALQAGANRQIAAAEAPRRCGNARQRARNHVPQHQRGDAQTQQNQGDVDAKIGSLGPRPIAG